MVRRVRCTLALTAALLFASLAVATAAGAPGRAVVRGKLTAKAGKTLTIFENKDFKVTGTCEDNGGGDLTAATFLRAKRKNLSYWTYGADQGVDPISEHFGPADGKIAFNGNDASGTTPDLEEAEYYEFYAVGAHGRVLRGHVATSVHLHGSDCGFGGEFVGTSRSGPLRTVGPINVKAGASKPIFANDDFKLVGTCTDASGGDLHADVFLTAKRNHLAYYLTEPDQMDTDFGPGSGPVNAFTLAYEANGPDPDFQASSYFEDIYALGKGGKVFQARVGTAVHWRGADCQYSGTFIGPRSDDGLKVVNVKKADSGEHVEIFQNSDFRVVGKCIDNGAGKTTADTKLFARRAHLATSAYEGTPFTDLDFNPGDPPVDITGEDATGDVAAFRSVDQYTDFWGEAPHGGGLNGRVGTGVHMLGADCIFTGIFAS